jgi:hypothetical protein
MVQLQRRLFRDFNRYGVDYPNAAGLAAIEPRI